MTLPHWNDISDDNKHLLATFIETFTLKDGTRMTSDVFGHGESLGLEMFMLARRAIEEAMEPGPSFRDIKQGIKDAHG